MQTREAITLATRHLETLKGRAFDVLTLSKPDSPEAAVNLSKVVSKLSPLLANMIEFHTVQFLNTKKQFHAHGKWIRQDPGFPDAVFSGSITPAPGFEIKTWFPLATEMTARFKDSQNHFADDQTYVVILAWLPKHLLYGKPYILDVCVVSALSVARARDGHYHNPPDYLVLEPEDTSERTRNLQQTNTNGYKWQGTRRQFLEAEKVVEGWRADGRKYKPTREYQTLVRTLISRFPYRLDTNFAKMDRIGHAEIEEFKARVLATKVVGNTVLEWSRLLYRAPDEILEDVLKKRLHIVREEGKAVGP